MDQHWQDLCSKSKDRFDLWSQIARSHAVRHCAEVGVWRGSFSAHILAEVPTIQSYHMIDPWRPLDSWNKPLNVNQDIFNESMKIALNATQFARSKVLVHRGTTTEVEPDIPDQSLDFIYIDGDHTLRGITIDLIRMMRKLRPGGLLAGDDYHSNPWHHGVNYEPTLICPFARYFAEAMDLPFVALPFHQFLIINVPEGFRFLNVSGRHSPDQIVWPRRPFPPANVRKLLRRLRRYWPLS